MSARLPVLFDTDIGSNVDDVLALSYLLRQPRCELLGVTTVSREPVERAKLASVLCRAAGRDDLPIHPGAAEPFLVCHSQRPFTQGSVLSRWPHRKELEPDSAVPFLRETIRAHPGKVTLLAVGPFTNVALLFALDPEIPRLLRRLVLMGGTYTEAAPEARRTEWNATCDPHATARLLQGPVRDLTAFGLDVTLRCRMSAEELRPRLPSLPGPAAELVEEWLRERESVTFHDPLAAAALFHPGLCRYRRGTVEVELQSGRALGMTHWRPATRGPHRIAVDVDPGTFFRRFFEVFAGQAAGSPGDLLP